MMFVAGCLIWANLQKKITSTQYKPATSSPSYEITIIEYGWPYKAAIFCNDSGPAPSMRVFEQQPLYSKVRVLIVLHDALFALLIIVATWAVCEAWIYFRSRRKRV